MKSTTNHRRVVDNHKTSTLKGNHTVIVGAGIIGTWCALNLAEQRDPATITIVDRDPFAYDNASCVNMGGFAMSEVCPLASLHNIWRAIRWLPNRQAPLALSLKYIPTLMPWLRVFLKSAFSSRHFDHVVKSQQSLMRYARNAHLECLGDTGLEKLVNRNGAICLYKSCQRLEADWTSRWRMFLQQGFECRRLPLEELREYLPDVSPQITHALHVPDIHFWEEPQSLLSGLHDLLKSRGVRIRKGNVVGTGVKANQVSTLMLSTGEEWLCRDLVIAAGAFSKPLCRDLGDNVPLDTERGYSTSLPNAGVNIKHLLLIVEDDFVVTPMRSGLRLGGTVELAGLVAPPDFSRTELLANQIRDYFPGICTDSRTDMLGFRPSMPDGLPVISQASRLGNAYYAFGHGHVGMTQSAITGKLIAQLITDQRPDVDLEPFSVTRFS